MTQERDAACKQVSLLLEALSRSKDEVAMLTSSLSAMTLKANRMER
jgi:hypothetical protein